VLIIISATDFKARKLRDLNLTQSDSHQASLCACEHRFQCYDKWNVAYFYVTNNIIGFRIFAIPARACESNQPIGQHPKANLGANYAPVMWYGPASRVTGLAPVSRRHELSIYQWTFKREPIRLGLSPVTRYSSASDMFRGSVAVWIKSPSATTE
jgi:hypothetical protein